MKMILKKSISVFIAVLMVLSICPLTSFAQTSNDYGYREIANNNGVSYVELTGYNGSSRSITLPTELDGKVVVGTYYNFIPNSKIKPNTIIVPEGYDYIGGFRGVKNLSISLPSTLKYIGGNAFANDTIANINFPEGLEAIDFEAFKGVVFLNNSNITLPDSLKYIAAAVFKDSNITSIHIGKNTNYANMDEYHYGVDFVAEVHNYNDDFTYYPFVANCTDLKSITVDNDNPYFCSENNILLSKDKSILWIYPAGLEKTDYITPEYVKYINSRSFCGAKFNNLTVSNNVLDFGKDTFMQVNADNVYFEANTKLNVIPEYAFSSANISDSIVIPSVIETIDTGAFSNCTSPNVVFEENSMCKTIESFAFINSKIETITIPSSVNSLGESVFYGCNSLYNVTFDDNSCIDTWRAKLFDNCTALTNIDTGKNNMVKSIYCNFSSTSITEFDFSNCCALSYIDYACFQNNTKIQSVNLSNTDLYSLSNTFKGCSNLKSIVLPTYLYSLSDTFYDCKNLESVNTENVVIISEKTFYNCSNIRYIPQSPTIKSNDEYSYYELESSITICDLKDKISFHKNIVIPNEINGKPVTRIGEHAFSGVEAESIVVPNTVVSICENAFSYAMVDDGITLPDSVEYIAKESFRNYQNNNNAMYSHENINTSFVLPKNLRKIGNASFYKSGITDVKINENVVYIAGNAFNSTQIENVIIPDSVIHIDKCAFNTHRLKTIIFGANVSNIDSFIVDSFLNPVFFKTGSHSFYLSSLRSYPEEFIVSADNKKFTSVDGAVYNNSVTKLIAFPNSKSLDDFTFPSTVTEFGEASFGNYSNSATFSIPNTVNKIDDNAFIYCKSLVNVFIPSSVKNIGISAFGYSESLENVEFDSDTDISLLDETFLACKSIKNVIFGNNCTIQNLIDTFYESGIEKIDLNCNARILSETFMQSQLKEITLHEGLEEIDHSAFSGTDIEKIIIPSTVKFIGGYAFSDCENLSYVNLSNVQGIDYAAFKNCTSLESIDLTGVYYIGGYSDDYAFYGCNNLKKFYFAAEEKEAYIAENEFSGDDQIETVVIGNNITEIQDYAFANCTNLETALIADEVEDISDTAFENCEKLTIVCLYASPAMYYAQKNDIKYETVQSFVVSPIPDQTYTGKAIKPSLTVKQGANNLTANVDYSATYSNNINVGKAKVVVTGLGDYKIFGTTANFNIVAAKPTHTHSYTSKVTKAATCGTNGVRTYTCSCGSSYTQTINATGNHTYKTYITKATKTANGKIETKCTGCGKISSTKTVYYPKTYTLSTNTYTYDGKVKTPTLTIKDYKGNTLKKDRDYKISYPSGRKSVGKYTYKITFIGNYSGTATKTFTIKPKATSISKLTAKSKGFTVTWKKRSTQTTGYQIQIATDSKFTKGVKSYTVSKNSTTSKSITKLTGKKKYYVRIRTYKTVKVNGKNTKIYSSWSGSKYITTKK